jgi:photosystem II stability/assembly factor-like uncharacterized protein
VKKLLLLLAIPALFLFSCRKNNSNLPGSHQAATIQLLTGDHQSGLYGELLADTLVFNIQSANPDNNFLIKFQNVQGNGSLDRDYPISFYEHGGLEIYEAGVLKLTWRLGCNNTLQKIKVLVYADSTGTGKYSSQPSDSLIVTANASKPQGWCRSCGEGLIQGITSQIFTYDNNTLYLASNGIYSSTDGGLNWYKVEGAPVVDVIDAQFNSKEWLYLLTRDSGIIYSKDMKNWTTISTGINDVRWASALFVDDTTVIAGFYFSGLFKSDDNGTSWKKINVGEFDQPFHFINRHPDGRLMLFDKWSYLYESADNGDSWTPLYFTPNYISGEVRDFKIDAQGMMYFGCNDTRLSVVDPVTYQGTVHDHYESNHMSQWVGNIKFANNDVYYLCNLNPAQGIYSRNNGWNKLTVPDFGERIHYFFPKSNGSFIVASGLWLWCQE